MSRTIGRPMTAPTTPDTIRVKGYDNHHELKNVATGLRARGYGDADILKIMGGNWMRIFTENFG